MLQATTEGRIALTGVWQELGYHKQGNPFGGVWRARQLGQHQMDNVVHQIVLTAGDPDFGALNRVAAIIIRRGFGANQAQIGATMGLGQAHGAGPFAGNQFFQIRLLKLFRAVGKEGADGTMRQAGVHAQRQVSGAHHLVHHEFQRVRQALAAKLQWRVQRGPATFDKLLVGLFEAVWSLDQFGFGVVAAALTVANLVGGLNDLCRQLAGLINDRGDQVRCGIGIFFQLVQLVCTQHIKQQKAKIVRWCLVLHGYSPVLI